MEKFERYYNATEFGLTADVSVNAGEWKRIGEIIVPAQTLLTFGAGAINNGVDYRREAKIILKDSSGSEISGKVRFAILNAQETKKIVVSEERTEELSTSVKLGEYMTKAKEDSKLVIEFQPDLAATISAANSTILVPTTAYV